MLTYLSDFLFPPQRAQAPVKMLSGGERNRLLLARLFARPANLLVLDEPTNDLDIESLELLEATLQDYAGTLLLVSHDRVFLDNVVTQTLVAEGDGVARIRRRPATGCAAACAPAEASRSSTPPARGVGERGTAAPARAKPAKAGLSFKERLELDKLPALIEKLEAEQHALTASVCAPDYHRQGPDVARRDRLRAAEIEHELATCFERWTTLEAKSVTSPAAAR